MDRIDNKLTKYDSFICKPIKISGAKKIKIIKRGWRNLINDPSIIFNSKKETIALHFDMHHGHKNLEKAISVMSEKDQSEFLHYVENNISYNPHIMVISKKRILNKWFSSLFEWLFKCENIHGFDKQL